MQSSKKFKCSNNHRSYGLHEAELPEIFKNIKKLFCPFLLLCSIKPEVNAPFQVLAFWNKIKKFFRWQNIANCQKKAKTISNWLKCQKKWGIKCLTSHTQIIWKLSIIIDKSAKFIDNYRLSIIVETSII